MALITLTLPIPPSVNSYYSVKQGGRSKSYVYVSGQGKVYQQEVMWLVKQQAPGWVPLTGWLDVHIDYIPPDRRAEQDIDNINKALLDALEAAGVFKNDKQIVHLNAFKFPVDFPYKPEGFNTPGVTVTVREISV